MPLEVIPALDIAGGRLVHVTGSGQVEASAFGDSLLYLDRAELEALRDSLQALAEPYLDRIADPALRPPGARPVGFVQIAFPVDEP